ncbi:MAG: S8 family serine peptidase, partial [candidate division Zixibacteria bacterium]|nr:S8 family serine peptidase [candidate division Zixibacteria bacterium]
MRKRVIFLNIALIVLVLCWAINSMGESSCRDIPGVLLVKFKSGLLTDHDTGRSGKLTTGITSFDLLNTKYNVSDIRKVFPEETTVPPSNSNLMDLSGFYEIEFPEESNLQALISIYSQDPNLEIVETVKMCPVDAVPNDPETQWHLNNLLGNDADVDAYEAWDLETGDSSIILAILDTGVGYYCPELSWNIWTNPGEIPDNGIDDDLNGKVDDYYGWDFVTGGYLCDVAGGEDCSGADNNPSDFDGHGTHVSGIAAAVTNNNAGVAGLAGGWYPAKKGCKIMALRTGWHATDGRGYINMDFAAQAMYYARIKGAKAINCSFGTSYTSALQAEVINAINQGIVICKSAGNDNQEVDDYLIDNFLEVLGVAALNRYDQKASFSNFGNEVDISAPGDDIRSVGGENYGCGIAVYSGTSQAAPMVTGLVGLLRSRVPNLTIAQITSLIKDNADSIDYLNPGYEGKLGAGRISLYRSLL